MSSRNLTRDQILKAKSPLNLLQAGQKSASAQNIHRSIKTSIFRDMKNDPEFENLSTEDDESPTTGSSINFMTIDRLNAFNERHTYIRKGKNAVSLMECTPSQFSRREDADPCENVGDEEDSNIGHYMEKFKSFTVINSEMKMKRLV